MVVSNPNIFLKPYENAFLWNLLAFSPTDLIKVPSTSKVNNVFFEAEDMVVRGVCAFVECSRRRRRRRATEKEEEDDEEDCKCVALPPLLFMH